MPNRKARREKLRGTPKHLRGVPVLDISAEQLASYFPGKEDGDIMTIAGFGRDQKGGVVRVAPGKETPLRVKVRQNGMVKRQAD